MLTSRITENLRTDSAWQEVQKHIEACVDRLDTLEEIDFTQEGALIKAEGRKQARVILKEILEPFMNQAVSEESKKEEALYRFGI